MDQLQDISAQTIFNIGDFHFPFNFEAASRYHLLLRLMAKDFPPTIRCFDLQSLGRIRRCERCGDRTRSSVTYSIADPHAIVSLANNHSLKDPPYAATPHSARPPHGKFKECRNRCYSHQTLKNKQFHSNLPLKTAGVSVEQSTIGGSVVIKGEVSGCESLFIEGHIEGTVDFTDHRVTIGSALSPPTSVPA